MPRQFLDITAISLKKPQAVAEPRNTGSHHNGDSGSAARGTARGLARPPARSSRVMSGKNINPASKPSWSMRSRGAKASTAGTSGATPQAFPNERPEGDRSGSVTFYSGSRASSTSRVGAGTHNFMPVPHLRQVGGRLGQSTISPRCEWPLRIRERQRRPKSPSPHARRAREEYCCRASA